jgi:hypothetical protein
MALRDALQTRRFVMKDMKALLAQWIANQPKRTRGNPAGRKSERGLNRLFQVALDGLHRGPFGCTISSAIGKWTKIGAKMIKAPSLHQLLGA